MSTPSNKTATLFEQAASEVSGLEKSIEALKACGMSPELCAHLLLQCQGMGVPIILRAGKPTPIDGRRGSKPGTVLSKTTQSGLAAGYVVKKKSLTRPVDSHAVAPKRRSSLASGYLPRDKNLTRAQELKMQNVRRRSSLATSYNAKSLSENELAAEANTGNLNFFQPNPTKPPKAVSKHQDSPKRRKVRGHHKEVMRRLSLSANSIDYQHTVQLKRSFYVILKEIINGDELIVLGYDDSSSQLRLGYRDGKRPENFEGEFVIKLDEGEDSVVFYAHKWDSPSFDDNYDEESGLVTQPEELKCIPSHVYEKVFRQTLPVYLSKEPLAKNETHFSDNQLDKFEVLANTSRSLTEFLATVPDNHPKKNLLRNSKDLSEALGKLTPDEAREIYDRAPNTLAVAGDWDGLALPYSPALPSEFREIFNTFDKKNGAQQKEALMKCCKSYLDYLIAEIQHKQQSHTLSKFGKLLLQLKTSHTELTDIISQYAIDRAGCVTAHEFLFQQLINYSYRCEHNQHYGENVFLEGLQYGLEQGLSWYLKMASTADVVDIDIEEAACIEACEKYCEKHEQHLLSLPNEAVLKELKEHLINHLKRAIQEGKQDYQIPHPHFDMNMQDLFQHGFDMRNPYGSNLEGAWLMTTPDGGILYGETQEQLIEVLLLGDFLKDNIIEINHGADMHLWHEVISKQLSYGQASFIPTKTLANYLNFKIDSESLVDSDLALFQRVMRGMNNENTAKTTSNKLASYYLSLQKGDLEPWFDYIAEQLADSAYEQLTLSQMQDYFFYQIEQGNEAQLEEKDLDHYLAEMTDRDDETIPAAIIKARANIYTPSVPVLL